MKEAPPLLVVQCHLVAKLIFQNEALTQPGELPKNFSLEFATLFTLHQDFIHTSVIHRYVQEYLLSMMVTLTTLSYSCFMSFRVCFRLNFLENLDTQQQACSHTAGSIFRPCTPLCWAYPLQSLSQPLLGAGPCHRPAPTYHYPSC